MKWKPASAEELAARGIKPAMASEAPTPVEVQAEAPAKPKRKRKTEE